MKKLFLTLCLCASVAKVFSQTNQPVRFSSLSLTGTRNNRPILIQPDRVQNPLVLGTNLIPIHDFTVQPVNGEIITNLIPWGYTIKVDGWPRSAHIVVTNAPGILDAARLINPNAFAPITIYTGDIIIQGGGLVLSNGNLVMVGAIDPNDFSSTFSGPLENTFSGGTGEVGAFCLGGGNNNSRSGWSGMIGYGNSFDGGDYNVIVGFDNYATANTTFVFGLSNRIDNQVFNGVVVGIQNTNPVSDGEMFVGKMNKGLKFDGNKTTILGDLSSSGTVSLGGQFFYANEPTYIGQPAAVTTNLSGFPQLNYPNGNILAETFLYTNGPLPSVGCRVYMPNGNLFFDSVSGDISLLGGLMGPYGMVIENDPDLGKVKFYGDASNLEFTNAAGARFTLVVNSTTNGFTFVPVP